MTLKRRLIAGGLGLGLLAGGFAMAAPVWAVEPDPAIACSFCDMWNGDRAPFQVFGNTYYVGTGGLGAVLIASDEGHILLDGALPQSAPIIDANIRALGFKTEDVVYIANSHAHFDHAGGINALQTVSGAAVLASPHGAQTLATGDLLGDDPQAAFPAHFRQFPAVANTQAVADGESVRVGPVTLTAHHTPGHTPGSTAWTWESCEGERCVSMAYADSLNAVSAPGFLFTGSDGAPSREAAFRASIETVRDLPCDILLAPHPEFTDLAQQLAAREAGASGNPFIDPTACGRYADAALERLEARLAEEQD